MRRDEETEKEEAREYIFVSEDEFYELYHAGFFIPSIVPGNVNVNGVFHSTGIAKKENWPRPPAGTELILSFFGTRAPLVKKTIAPEIKTCFISHHSTQEMEERIIAGCAKKGIDPSQKLLCLKQYIARQDWQDYDFVVYNDTTPEECAREIIRRSRHITIER